jgi:hypothetical protein
VTKEALGAIDDPKKGLAPPHYALDEGLFADFPVAAAVLQRQQEVLARKKGWLETGT